MFQHLHKPNSLNQSQIKVLANLTNVTHMNQVLDNICIPRVVGTSGHERVRQVLLESYIIFQ